MSFDSISGSGVSFGEGMWGEAFTLSGQSLRGTIADVRGEGRVLLEGQEEFADLIIEASRSQFTSEPKPSPRAIVSARGSSWRLAAVTVDELTYTLICKLAK